MPGPRRPLLGQAPLDLGQQSYKDTVSPYARANISPNLLQSVPLGEDILKVPTPPDFRPDPTVVGSPTMAREVHDVLRKVPELRGMSPSITAGPTADSFAFTQDSNLLRSKAKLPNSDRDPINFFKESNLLGLTNNNTNKVSINPRLNEQSKNFGMDQSYYPIERKDTIAHELAHVAGIPNDDPRSTVIRLEPGANALGEMWVQGDKEKRDEEIRKKYDQIESEFKKIKPVYRVK